MILNGSVTATGDTMSLEECEYRAKFLPAGTSQPVCINTMYPRCRIYLVETEANKELNSKCRALFKQKPKKLPELI